MTPPDRSRFSAPPKEAASIEAFVRANPGAETGSWRIAYPDSRLDLEFVRRGSDTLMVVLGGARSRRAPQPAPFFSGRRLGAGTGLSTLVISDPALHLSDGLLLGWYAGTARTPLEADLPRVVEALFAGSGARRLMLVGGSGGGFAALKLAAALTEAGIEVLALVWNAQTTIRRYKASARRDYARLAWGRAEGEEDAFLDSDPRFRLAPWSGRFGLVYLQNVHDDLHLTQHLPRYLPGAVGKIDAPNTGVVPLGDNGGLWLENFGLGHQPPEKAVVGAVVRRLAAPATDWTRLPFDDIAAALRQTEDETVDDAGPAKRPETSGDDPRFSSGRGVSQRWIVVTRLAPGRRDHARLSAALDQILTTTLPTLAAQTVPELEWVITLDPGAPSAVAEVLTTAAQAAGLTLRLEPLDPVTDTAPPVEAMVGERLSEAAVVGIARLDAGQAVGPHWMARLRDAVDDFDADLPMAMTLVDGLRIDLASSRIAAVRKRHNLIGMAVAAPAAAPRSPFAYSRAIEAEIEAEAGMYRALRSQTPLYAEITYPPSGFDPGGVKPFQDRSWRFGPLDAAWIARGRDLAALDFETAPLPDEVDPAALKTQLRAAIRILRKRDADAAQLEALWYRL